MAQDAEKILSINTPNGAGEPDSEKPKFDFSRTSYQDMRLAQRLATKLKHVTKLINGADESTDIDALLDQQDDFMNQQESLIVKPLVSVPRSWQVVGAPDEIDWHDRASLQWLRANKFAALAEILFAEQNAKN